MTDKKTVEVTAHDLPLHCPPAGATAWSQHPRVFLDIVHTGPEPFAPTAARITSSRASPRGTECRKASHLL